MRSRWKIFKNGHKNLWLIQKNNYTKYPLSFAILSLFSIFFFVCVPGGWTLLTASSGLSCQLASIWIQPIGDNGKGSWSLFSCALTASVSFCVLALPQLCPSSQPHYMALIVTRLLRHHFLPLFFWFFGWEQFPIVASV